MFMLLYVVSSCIFPVPYIQYINKEYSILVSECNTSVFRDLEELSIRNYLFLLKGYNNMMTMTL